MVLLLCAEGMGGGVGAHLYTTKHGSIEWNLARFVRRWYIVEQTSDTRYGVEEMLKIESVQ